MASNKEPKEGKCMAGEAQGISFMDLWREGEGGFDCLVLEEKKM